MKDMDPSFSFLSQGCYIRCVKLVYSYSVHATCSLVWLPP